MTNYRLYFATSNKDKAAEFSAILRPVNVVAIDLQLEEIQNPDLKVISRHKAMQAAEELGEPAVVDDSGLFIKSLNGFPGPYSAYAEETIGLQGILDLLANKLNRTAKFVSVISYAEPDGEARIFRGEAEGTITTTIRGENGFGFDPIFEYNGRTFAEMDRQEKNMVSHRFLALQAFRGWYMVKKVYDGSPERKWQT